MPEITTAWTTRGLSPGAPDAVATGAGESFESFVETGFWLGRGLVVADGTGAELGKLVPEGEEEALAPTNVAGISVGKTSATEDEVTCRPAASIAIQATPAIEATAANHSVTLARTRLLKGTPLPAAAYPLDHRP